MAQRPILIAGPTASGKSELAVTLAERHGGIVINADSMQVYRELAILTARPDAEDEARVRHALYGHVAAREAYSVGRWLEDVRRTLEQARIENRRPIIVGGTGLYFRALLEGLSPVPAIPDDIRAHWRSEAVRLGAAGLHAVLVGKDAEMAARLRPTDPQRITRALEVLEATGLSLAAWQTRSGTPLLVADETERLLVLQDRQELFARCDTRFDGMLMAGGLEEARRLLALDLDPMLPAMRAVGVRPLLLMLSGQLDETEAIARAKQDTRHYVRRQLTWINRHMSAWQRYIQQ
ncbi:MAG: tRNA (adenosine(37)-N6)-dimethylallyltransferase MiaA [Hyphomicrobiaceae bacterium]